MSKAYIEVDCNLCGNCTGSECLKYGTDADVAVKRCAAENFRNYVTEQCETAMDSTSN